MSGPVTAAETAALQTAETPVVQTAEVEIILLVDAGIGRGNEHSVHHPHFPW